MMFGVICPQCKRASNEASTRLVRDACGHQKCRICLLADEENCRQCKEVKDGPLLENVNGENHTGVITCNGAAGPCPPNQNGVSKTKTENVGEKVKRPKIHLKKSKPARLIPNHVTILKEPLRYLCKVCDKEFFTRANIRYHIYCTGQSKPFQCSFCAKTFITKSHLEAHLHKHTGTKPFVCHICQKAFSEKSKLKRHNLLHTSTKPYVCAECGKAFRSKESLKIHILIHRGEKPYSCRVCSLSFNNTSNLKKHLISHSAEKSHMCDQCGKRFKIKSALTVHRRSHLKIRPFQCIDCSKAFVNNKDLQRHQLVHLDSKAYHCSFCPNTFRRKDNLNRHVKNFHPGKKIDTTAVTVKELLIKKPVKPVDNPNAVNVITTSPTARKLIKTDVVLAKPLNKTTTSINGPLKLAFKTSAFKSNYNIKRDYDKELLPNTSKPYDLAQSVNICQKILSPSSPQRNILTRNVSESTSTEICQKILSPYPTKPIHYETSFEHKTHAMIKNIKFKLPSYYTNLKTTDTFKDVIPLKPAAIKESPPRNGTYTELKNSATSVIVNSNLEQRNMHWRRRTAQNLCSKVLAH